MGRVTVALTLKFLSIKINFDFYWIAVIALLGQVFGTKVTPRNLYKKSIAMCKIASILEITSIKILSCMELFA